MKGGNFTGHKDAAAALGKPPPKVDSRDAEPALISPCFLAQKHALQAGPEAFFQARVVLHQIDGGRG